MKKSIMIQGTSSGSGKSMIVTALCRYFSNLGLKVSPFKAQNMALNSFVTVEGGEIGRSQALQAEAARVVPSVHMNPILLKAEGESFTQLIVHGRWMTRLKAKDYYGIKKNLWKYVRESIEILQDNYELLVVEGAGSPAEINLMETDIVNMAVAKHLNSPVLLVGDIERGGVFASLFGTMSLLGEDVSLIQGLLINKFRGDREILKPGILKIESITGKKVMGVIPYLKNLLLPEEDSLGLNEAYGLNSSSQVEKLKVVVVRLPYISNFTDFDPLCLEEDVELLYSLRPSDIESADLIILPGTKKTVEDLLFLREKGLDKSLKKAKIKGSLIIGICGGYQMLGKKLIDSKGVESPHKEVPGLGFLDIETLFEDVKYTCQVNAKILREDLFTNPIDNLCGYEIHKGITRGNSGLFLLIRTPGGEEILDGTIEENCMGTYVHGIFENDLFRREILNLVRKRKGLEALPCKISYAKFKDTLIENLAKKFVENVEINSIMRLLKL